MAAGESNAVDEGQRASRRLPKIPKKPKGSGVLMVGKVANCEGASYGEHPNARRERLRRIAGGR